MHRILLAGFLAASAGSAALPALAAAPKKSADYEGTVKVESPGGIGKGTYRKDFFLRVSPSGKKLRVSFPLVCGTARRGVASGITISSRGKFSGTRDYTEVRFGTTLKWSLRIDGGFTSATKAKGHLTVGLRRHGAAGSGRENEIVCGTAKDLAWTAKYFAVVP